MKKMVLVAGLCCFWATVTLVAGYTSSDIADRAYADRTDLKNITIPNSVKYIGWGAFRNCTGLTSITIPNSVITIGSEAFAACTGLTNITIPNSVINIEHSAFSFCENLTSRGCRKYCVNGLS